LDLLRRQNLIRVPDTVACTQVDDAQILLLQWIGQGIRSLAFWRRFGEQLARLHRVTAPTFGLDHNNYMGSLSQDNTPSATRIEFFQTRRLEPQVRLAARTLRFPRVSEKYFTHNSALLIRVNPIFAAPPELLPTLSSNW